MALKDKGKAVTMNAGTAQAGENETANASTAAAGAIQDAGNGVGTEEETSTAPTSTKGRGGPRGPKGPRFQWSNPMQETLATLVKSPKGHGSIRTAGAVAAALNGDPAFVASMQEANPTRENPQVTPEQVESFLAIVRKGREEKGLPVHDYLTLDKARVSAPALDLF